MDIIQPSYPHVKLAAGGKTKDIPTFLKKNLFRGSMQESGCKPTPSCKGGRELQTLTWVAVCPAEVWGSVAEGKGESEYCDRLPASSAIQCINSFIGCALPPSHVHTLYRLPSYSKNASPQFCPFPRLHFYDFFSLSKFPLMFVLICFYPY